MAQVSTSDLSCFRGSGGKARLSFGKDCRIPWRPWLRLPRAKTGGQCATVITNVACFILNLEGDEVRKERFLSLWLLMLPRDASAYAREGTEVLTRLLSFLSFPCSFLRTILFRRGRTPSEARRVAYVGYQLNITTSHVPAKEQAQSLEDWHISSLEKSHRASASSTAQAPVLEYCRHQRAESSM